MILYFLIISIVCGITCCCIQPTIETQRRNIFFYILRQLNSIHFSDDDKTETLRQLCIDIIRNGTYDAEMLYHAEWEYIDKVLIKIQERNGLFWDPEEKKYIESLIVKKNN